MDIAVSISNRFQFEKKTVKLSEIVLWHNNANMYTVGYNENLKSFEMFGT